MLHKLLLVLMMLVPLSVSAGDISSCEMVSWEPPVAREDGQSLSPDEIEHYTILTGKESGEYTTSRIVPSPETSISCALLELTGGTNFIAGTTTDTDGVVSQISNEIMRVLPLAPPSPMVFKVTVERIPEDE